MLVGDSNAAPFLHRPRRIIGLCLLALGIILMARDLWLGFFYWSGFGAEDRIRFFGLLWVGTVLILAGCWLGLRLRGAVWALVVVILSFPVVAYFYEP